MWALVENDEIVKVYPRPKAIKVGDINYPSNIMSLWSSTELEAIGIYEVVVDNTNLKNVEYYINGAGSIAFADGVVTQSYSTATAKSLDDILWTQEDIDSLPHVPEDVSVGDLQVRGLKFLHKAKINNQAGGILAVTDWYRIREDDGGTEMPAAVLTFRTTIRSESNTMCGLIDAAADIDELEALYIYSGDPSTRPLGSWSELE